MAERDSQRYYWLKLDKDFFNEYKIRSLMSKKNGDTYVTILLQLKNECLNYDGVLRYSQKRAYTVQELASVINRPVKALEDALDVLEEMELIERDEDGTIRMDVEVGSETYQTKRKRDGNSVVNSTNDLPKEVVKTTLDIRDKRIENEEDIKIKEIAGRLLELGYSSEFVDKTLSMFYRSIYPKTADMYRKIVNTMTDDSIYNKEGYIYKIMENEVKA